MLRSLTALLAVIVLTNAPAIAQPVAAVEACAFGPKAHASTAVGCAMAGEHVKTMTASRAVRARSMRAEPFQSSGVP